MQPDASFGVQFAEPEPSLYDEPAAEPERYDDGGKGALRVVPVERFAATEEEGAGALVGNPDEALIAERSDTMVYGDGGSGKTTLTIDLGCHLAAGDPWLGVAVANPARVLLVELEGPRPLFRAKLRRKLDAWSGSPLGGRLRVLENPWATFSFADELHRATLAAAIAADSIDVVILGPVTRAGMDEAGTLQETRDFMKRVELVRAAAGRPVSFILIHHSNKGGQVSGAWEGTVDTVLHVQGQGHGRTRLYVQKARWSTAHHATAFNLLWTDGEGFAIEARPEITEETIETELATAALENPGITWTKIRALIKGKNTAKEDARDRLLARGVLVNSSPVDGRFNLWHSDDPASPRSRPGTTQERLSFPHPDEGPDADPFPVPAFKGNGENGNGAEGPRAQAEHSSSGTAQ